MSTPPGLPAIPSSRLPVFLLAAAVAACSEAAGGLTATVTDSAGIQIVTSTAPAWTDGEGWVVDSVPLLDIGGSDTDPHYDLLRVSGMTQLSDGRIAVLTAGTNNIQFYDSTGTWLSSMGRDGEGPGEFRSPFGLFRLPGDTLLVYDYQLRRMVRLSSNGTYLTAVQANESLGGLLLPFARLRDGSWLASGIIAFGPDAPSGPYRSSTPIVHLGDDFALLDTVIVLPGNEIFVRRGTSADGRRTMGMSTIPLGVSSSYAASDSLLIAGDQAQYEIGFYRVDGTLVRSIRRPVSREKITPAMLDRLKEEDLANARDRDDALARWEELPKPAEMPAFAELSLDAEGNLWVARPKLLRSDTTVADVFDHDGKWLGPVTLPPGFRPTEIGPDYMLGVWKDDVGLEHVRRYGIGGKAGRREELGREGGRSGRREDLEE